MPQKKMSQWKHSKFQSSSSSSEDVRADRSCRDERLGKDWTPKFHLTGCLIKESKESWNRSLKESLKRDEKLVKLTEDAKKTQEREGVLRTYEMWLREREKDEVCETEGRRAQFVAREARDNFEKSLAKMTAKDDSKQDETGVIADKLWQSSQGNHTKGMNLANDLDALTAATENNWWNKSRKSSAFMWVKW